MIHTTTSWKWGLPVLLLACLLIAPAVTGKVKVSVSGGYEEIESFKDGQIEYVSLSDLVDIVGGSLDWETIGFQVKYDGDGFRFDFIIDSPFLRLNDTLFNITYPVLYREGKLYVAPATFIPILDQVTPQQITWDGAVESIRIDSEYFNVTDVSFSAKANGLLVEIYLTRALAYDIFVTEGNWLNVSIRDGKVNSPRIVSRRDSRYMYQIKAHQVEGAAQVSIRLKRNAERWHHKLVYDPPRIQISVADASFEIDSIDTNPAIGPDDKIDVIVVDAGHGGKDYGAMGRDGTKEKEVVLKIAKELANLIRKDRQFKVIMTRDQDKEVSLDERAKIANDAGADLFISIHANASPKHQVRGWNVFFLAQAKNDSARSAAQLENSFFLRELALPEDQNDNIQDDLYNDPIVGILNEMIMTEFQVESHDFAMMVDREFRRNLDIPSRGVDQAGFFVLNKVFTPSVLIETAFISNKSEEKLLKQKSFQKQVAQGLYDAIKRFKTKYEQQ